MKLRAAAVSFLNARPLTAGLAGSPLIDLVLAEPSLCAAMLEAGEVDLALLPVGALPGRDWEVVPGHRPSAPTGRCRPWCSPARSRPALGRGLPRHRLAHLADPGPARAARARASRPATRTCRPLEGLARGGRAEGRAGHRRPGLRRAQEGGPRPGARVEPADRAAHGLRGLGGPPRRAPPRGRAGAGPRRPGRAGHAHRAGPAVRPRGRRRPGALPPLPDPEASATAWGRTSSTGWRPSSPAPPRPASCPPTTLRFADDVVRSRRVRRAVSLDTGARRRGPTASGSTPTRPRPLDEKAPLLELGLAADMRRRALHPDGVVTYIVSRNINYTNVCTTACPSAPSTARAATARPTCSTASSWPGRSRRRWRWAASRSCCRAGSTPTWASSGTRTSSAG